MVDQEELQVEKFGVHAAPSLFSGYQPFLAVDVDWDAAASGAERKDVT